MKKLLTYLLSAMMIFAVGCSEEFDDTAIWEKLNSLESRVAALEQLCKQMNTNITSLQSIVEALQNKDYVTSVAPITEDGKTIGYTITFSKSGAVTIYHGKDGKDGQNGANGKDGYTPTIGVAKASDGIYYWTLDGKWLTDNYGNKIKAEGRDGQDGADGKDGQDGADGKDGENGKDGADGKDGENGKDGADGITPKLKIENDYWYISYDNGKTWTELGKATGEDGADGTDGKDGDSMFQDVTYDDNYVYITLINGTRVAIPCHEVPAANEIWYTSSDGKIVKPYRWHLYETNANIVSNVYKDGKGVITFDNNIHGIFSFAFYECIKLTSITIPDGVTQIGDNAFWECSSLTSINIPNGVTLIGERAFKDCSSLTSITIPDGVTQIGDTVFQNCSSLTSITIPDGVTQIGDSAFSYCSRLTSINIPDGVTQIGDSAFSSCSRLTNINIPDGVTQIGDSAFSSCSSLTNINIPDGVTQIGDIAFWECSSLTSINIPNGVTLIGERAFQKCSSLTSITFPKSVQRIGRDAFCHAKVVYCMAAQPPYLGWPEYNTYGTDVIYVPTNSVAAYKAADGWSDYADIIVGYDF